MTIRASLLLKAPILLALLFPADAAFATATSQTKPASRDFYQELDSRYDINKELVPGSKPTKAQITLARKNLAFLANHPRFKRAQKPISIIAGKDENGKPVALVKFLFADGRALFNPLTGRILALEKNSGSKAKLPAIRQFHIAKSAKGGLVLKETDHASIKDVHRVKTAGMIPSQSLERMFNMTWAGGVHMFDGGKPRYGSLSGSPAPQGKFFQAPSRFSLAQKPTKSRFYLKDKSLYYVDKKGKQTAVGYTVRAAGKRMVFFHGGALPQKGKDGKDNGRHPLGGKLWTLFSIDKNGRSQKLGLYDHIMHGWKKNDVVSTKNGPRLNLDKVIARETVYSRDLKSKRTLPLFRYGAAFAQGKVRFQQYIDPASGKIYQKRLDPRILKGKKVYDKRIYETSLYARDIKRRPAVDIEKGRPPVVFRHGRPQGIKKLAASDRSARLLQALYFGSHEKHVGGAYKNMSFRDIHKNLRAQFKSVKSQSQLLNLIDPQLFKALDSKNPGIRSRAALVLGVLAPMVREWRVRGAYNMHAKISKALESAVQSRPKGVPAINGILPNSLIGLPSPQEASAHALMRMGKKDALGRLLKTSKNGPGAFWAAYVLAGEPLDILGKYRHSAAQRKNRELTDKDWYEDHSSSGKNLIALAMKQRNEILQNAGMRKNLIAILDSNLKSIKDAKKHKPFISRIASRIARLKKIAAAAAKAARAAKAAAQAKRAAKKKQAPASSAASTQKKSANAGYPVSLSGQHIRIPADPDRKREVQELIRENNRRNRSRGYAGGAHYNPNTGQGLQH